MKRVLFVAALLALRGGTTWLATAQGQKDGVWGVAREVERLAGGHRLWPDFDPLTVPLAIFDGERTYLFRHPAPPAGFVLVREDEPPVYVYEGRHPAVTANTGGDIGGRGTAILVLEPPGPDRTLTDLAAVALHEAFHIYQSRQSPGLVGADESNLFVYPIDDVRLASLRRLETRALGRALGASTSAETACWARRVLELRRERFAKMDAAFVAYDRGTEVNEGLAYYVELRAAGREDRVIPTEGFSAPEIRRRAYSTGAALALLLDRLRPGWPEAFQTGEWRYLDQALGAALGADWEDSSDACGFSADEIAESERIAREDVTAVLSGRAERRAAFEALSGWRVVIEAADGQPLWPHGFDPLNVERVEGGVLHERFLSLGNDSGRLEAIDAKGANIEVLTEGVGPHPLLNGVHRVVVAGLASPEVEKEGRLVTIRTAGFTASFEGANVQRHGYVVAVQLQATK